MDREAAAVVDCVYLACLVASRHWYEIIVHRTVAQSVGSLWAALFLVYGSLYALWRVEARPGSVARHEPRLSDNSSAQRQHSASELEDPSVSCLVEHAPVTRGSRAGAALASQQVVLSPICTGRWRSPPRWRRSPASRRPSGHQRGPSRCRPSTRTLMATPSRPLHRATKGRMPPERAQSERQKG